MLDVRKPSFDEVCDGSDRGSAAVGGEDRAGDVAGLGGGEEDDHAGDLIGLGGAGHQGGRAGGLGHAAEPACRARSLSWAGSPRSAAAKRAVPPAAVMAPATAPPRAGSRPCTMTTAPCRPSCTAAAWPIPDVAPVTRAVRPCRSRCSLIALVLPCRNLRAAGRASLAAPAATSAGSGQQRPPCQDQLNGSRRRGSCGQPALAMRCRSRRLCWRGHRYPIRLQRIRVIRTCPPGMVMSPQLTGRRGSRGAWPLTYRPVLPRAGHQYSCHARQAGYITRLSHVTNTRASLLGLGCMASLAGSEVPSSRIEPFCVKDQPVPDGGDGG